MIERDEMAERGRVLEDEYFRRRDRELVERAREQAADAQRRQQFAAAIGIDDERIMAALRQAGLDEHTASLIEIVPALYVAWADGRISEAERREIARLPQSNDVEATGRLGQRTLDTWLDRRPPDTFFMAALAALRARLEQLDIERRARLFHRMIADATSVGTASGGLLGFSAISDAESRCIRDLEAALTVSN